ncbi:hypothetical protein QBC34DRAFT_494217 [Podospora aff. communis PSN243]|uniref:HNH nuclease domain-containing protein n=1 Tax=Podospora aff. communis PSN243 TaxID=3040156 RepID=A0AAV9GN44_9PEZI|nr:hypothetical protein QBC34DRAFT_494217 [Podospora aff. communis PSN243]
MEAENVASIIPLDELTERLELIQKIEDKIRRWARRRGSDSASFALLLCAPIQFLRYHGHSLNVASSLSSSTSGLVKYSRHIWQLLRLFLEEDAQGPSATLSAERKAWDRESCVVTGDPLPVVCHIVPLTTCSDYTRVERFASSLWAVHTGLIPHEDIDYSALCHCLDGPGVSNHVWNMISVDPRIRDFRRHAGIGFKCLGIFPSERGPEESLVRVQPVLMVKGAVPWKRKKRNEAWLRQYVSPKETWLRRYVHVRVATVDARKMKMAFDIQWALPFALLIRTITGQLCVWLRPQRDQYLSAEILLDVSAPAAIEAAGVQSDTDPMQPITQDMQLGGGPNSDAMEALRSSRAESGTRAAHHGPAIDMRIGRDAYPAGWLASSLCGLAKTAINAESHVSSLCEEIATLARFLTSVDRALRSGHQLQLQHQFQSSTSLAPISVDENLWHQSSLALSDCQITLTELGALVDRIERVVRERKRLWRFRTAVDLKFHASELEACRAKINKSNWALQMILHAITVSLSLRSNASQDLILLELDRLKSCIDDALQAAVRTPGPGGFSTAVGDQSDARVARHLRDLARAARTFHSAASSTAGSTVRGEGSVAVPWGGNFNREGAALSVLGSFTPVARERVNEFVHSAAQIREAYPLSTDAVEDEPDVDDSVLDRGLERAASVASNPPPAKTTRPAPPHVDEDAEFVGGLGGELDFPVFEVLEDFAAESMKRHDFDKAADFLREATTQAGERGGTALSTAVLIRLRVRLAVCYLLQHRWQLAQDVVSTLTQQQKGKLSRPVCNLLHAVALAQLSAYLFEDAIATCKQTLRAKQHSLGPKDSDTVEALCLLATAYDMSGNLVYTEATRRRIPQDVVYKHPGNELDFIFGHEELLPGDIAIHIKPAPTMMTTIVHPAYAAELDSGTDGSEYGNACDGGTPSRSKSLAFGHAFADHNTETALRRRDRLEADTSKEVAALQAPRVTRSVSLPVLLQHTDLPQRRKTRYRTIRLPRMFRSKSQLQRTGSVEVAGCLISSDGNTHGGDTPSSDEAPRWMAGPRKRSPTVLRKEPPERRNTAPAATPAVRIGNNLRGILRWMGPKKRRRSLPRFDDDNWSLIVHWSAETSEQVVSPEPRGSDVVHGEDSSVERRDQDGVFSSHSGRSMVHAAELMAEPRLHLPRLPELHGCGTSPQVYDRYPFAPPPSPPASTTTAWSTDGDAGSIFSSAGSDGHETDDSSDHETGGNEDHFPSCATTFWGKPYCPLPSPLPNSGDVTASHGASTKPENLGEDTNPMLSESDGSLFSASEKRKTREVHRPCRPNSSSWTPTFDSNKPIADTSTPSSLRSNATRQIRLPRIHPEAPLLLCGPSTTSAAGGHSGNKDTKLTASILKGDTILTALDDDSTENVDDSSRDTDGVDKRGTDSSTQEDLEASTGRKSLAVTGEGNRTLDPGKSHVKQQRELRRTLSWIEGDDDAFWMRIAKEKKSTCD